MRVQHTIGTEHHARTWWYLAAALLGLHGLIHVLGFLSAWQLGDLTTTLSSTPIYPAGIATGSPLVLILGVLWLVTMLAFLTAAIGVVLGASWWKGIAVSAATVSLVLCLAWWNDAWVGALVDIAVVIGVLLVTWETRHKGTSQ
jgi:hypothetical protein